MTESLTMRPVVLPQQKSKTHVARNTLGLAGVAVGAAEATVINSTKFGNDIRRAVDSFNANKNVIKNTFTKKEYINNYIKDARIKRAGGGAAVTIAAAAAGMAIGTMIDGAINAIKNRNKKPVYLKEVK